MFRRINKIIENNPLKQRLNSFDGQARLPWGKNGGQVAIILILVIAAALIFYAVSLNLGRLTQTRALVTIASNTSASLLASNMASYGQQLSSTSLKGRDEVCGWTGFMAVLIALVIILIVAWSQQWWLLEGTKLLLAIVTVALAVTAVVVQAVVLQPGLTQSWNRIIRQTLSMRNQFTEGAIQSALGKVVTDSVQVPDVNDMDGDRIWVAPSELNSLPFADQISRFGMYYNERLQKIGPFTPGPAIDEFIRALDEFVHERAGGDGWAIHDPMPPEQCVGQAECFPCCFPDTVTFEGEEPLIELRPTDCPNSTNDTFWAGECGPASPYGAAYPWLYDPFYENPNNAFFSFRELIGLDDEHRDFYKDENDPNSDPASIPGLGRPTQFFHDGEDGGDPGFRLEDATGFYVPPYYFPTVPETRRGIYPFFYKMNDWGVDLAEVRTNLFDLPEPTDSRECHWCDVRGADCRTCDGLPPHPHPLEIPPLVLPLDPDPLSPDGLIYNTTYFVDGIGNPVDTDPNKAGNPPLAVDRVTIPLPGNIIAEDEDPPVCAQDTLYPPPGSADGFWREGGDRFCSPTAPYYLECPKGESCDLAEDKELFPDDAVDDLVYELANFIDWARRLLANAQTDMQALSDDFPNWYPEAAIWIEPEGTPPGPKRSVPCYLCDLKLPDEDETKLPEGILYIWLDEMTVMRDRILGWINNYNDATDVNEGYLGGSCTSTNDPLVPAVWCVPDAGLACPEVPPDEAATFDSNRNDVQGDVEDIVACLNYNLDGYDHVAAEAFRGCIGPPCNPANCIVGAGGTLPEFHLNGVTRYNYPVTVIDCDEGPEGWARGNPWYDAMERNLGLATKPSSMAQGNRTRFANCGNSCSLADCHELPRSMVPFASAPNYDPQNYQPLDLDTANGNWKDITAFNDCLNNCNPENCRVGPRLPTVHSSDGTPYAAYPAPVGGAPTAADCADWGPTNPWFDVIVLNKASVTPPDEPDMVPMIACAYQCSNATCQAMPAQNAATTVTYFPDNGDPLAHDFEAGGDCVDGRLDSGSSWYPEVNTALSETLGSSSCDLDEGWLDQTRQSTIEATNQMAKFGKRRDFLQGRLTEAQNILHILGEDLDGDGVIDTGAIRMFTDFLLGPAADLILARIDYDDIQDDAGLPFEAVYGWRSEDISPVAPGKWHIVKVEARVPGACETACGHSQARNSDPGWPRIHTYTKNWGTRRCYRLVNTRGVVKFRTTRWDEDKTSGSLFFPNGAPLWRFRSTNPQRPADGTDNPAHLAGDARCASSTIQPPLASSELKKRYYGAFMMNQFHPIDDPENNARCWNLAHRFLSRGVVNETCAEYYFHEGPGQGMGLKFVPCQEF